MNARLTSLLLAMGAAALLAACGEKPQVGASPLKKGDAKASQGAQNAYVASGWTPGDDTSWQTQLRTRAQQGQNEYTRSAAAPSPK
jgi:hypothetical protein